MKASPAETLARASSHHGYNYTGGAASWLSDAGITSRPAWGADEGRYYVSGGSHAGHAHEAGRGRKIAVVGGRANAAALATHLKRFAREDERFTPPSAVRLVPVERLAPHGRRWRFAVTPPWRKRVYRDPEYQATD